MLGIWQSYGAVTHCSSHTVKIIYLMTWFSSFLQNEVKLSDLKFLVSLLISTVKRDITFDFSLSSGTPPLPTDFQRHLLTVLQHRLGWSEEPWGEFRSMKPTWKTSHLSPNLFFPCFRLSSYLDIDTSCVPLSQIHAWKESDIQSYMLYQTSVFIVWEQFSCVPDWT